MTTPTQTPTFPLARTILSLSSLPPLSKLSLPTSSASTHLSTLWTSARPWSEFFNGAKFVAPSNLNEVRIRLQDNLSYFSFNYLVCFLVVCFFSVLVHPLAFLSILFIAGLYIVLFLHYKDGVKVGGITVAGNSRLAVFGTVAFVVLYATNAIGVMGSWGLLGGTLSILHAGGRESASEPDFESPVNTV